MIIRDRYPLSGPRTSQLGWEPIFCVNSRKFYSKRYPNSKTRKYSNTPINPQRYPTITSGTVIDIKNEVARSTTSKTNNRRKNCSAWLSRFGCTIKITADQGRHSSQNY